MSTSHELLARLNPTVRPVSAPTPVRQPAVPFEQRGFDDLLAEFGRNASPDNADANLGTDPGTPVAPTANTHRPAATLDLTRVENASLRTILAQQHDAAAQTPTPTAPTK